MKILQGVLAAMMMTASAFAAGGDATMRDWALHRQWMVELDRQHPERPARLVEIPWTSGAEMTQVPGRGASQAKSPPSTSAPVMVRQGAQIILVERDANAVVELKGTALNAGRSGDVIRVRAGLSGLLRGVVRGPGLVQLQLEKVR